MTNINLLPPDKRGQEEKERRKALETLGQARRQYFQPGSHQETEAKSQTQPKRWFSFFTDKSKPEAKSIKEEKTAVKEPEIKVPKKETEIVKEYLPEKRLEKPMTKTTKPKKVSWFRRFLEKRRQAKKEKELKIPPMTKEKEIAPRIHELKEVSVSVEPKKIKTGPNLWQRLRTWWSTLFAKKVPALEVQKEKSLKPVEIKSQKSVGKVAKEKLATKAEELEVNLIPQDILKQLNPQKKLLSLLLIIVSIIGITILIYYSLDWYQTRKSNEIQQLKKELASIENKVEILEQEKNQALNLQKRFLVASKLADEHVYWTRFFEKLEDYTLPEVYYSGFAGDISGKLTLKAVALDLRSLAKQIAVLKQATDFIQTVNVRSITAQTTSQGTIAGYNFNLEITLSPDLFTVTD